MGGGGGVVLRLFLAEWSCFRVVFALELMDWVSSSFIVCFFACLRPWIDRNRSIEIWINKRCGPIVE